MPPASSFLLMMVHITIPVYNEELQLRESVTRVQDLIWSMPEIEWELVIADNASTDCTPILHRN